MPKILIPLVVNPAWLGGIQYIRNLIRALDRVPRGDLPEIWLRVLAKEDVLLYQNEFKKYKWLRQDTPSLTVSQKIFSFVARRPRRTVPEGSWASGEVDAIFPVKYASFLPGPHERIFWIPDFQYKNIPSYFHENEQAKREAFYHEIFALKPLLVLSSDSVRKDFEKYFPKAVPDTAVEILRFTSVFDPEELRSDPGETTQRYGLPGRYVYMPNQFFVHKRHDIAFKALARLRCDGQRIPLVCTGHCEDFRDPGHFLKLKRYIEEKGLSDQIQILGVIPRRDQIQIYRNATLILQPSMSEGWSTSIEDARALGKPMILSDIEVHIEQAPPLAEYFRSGSVDDLAQRLATAWEIRHREHPQAHESSAVEAHAAYIAQYAAAALRIFSHACQRKRSRTKIAVEKKKLPGRE